MNDLSPWPLESARISLRVRTHYIHAVFVNRDLFSMIFTYLIFSLEIIFILLLKVLSDPSHLDFMPSFNKWKGKRQFFEKNIHVPSSPASDISFTNDFLLLTLLYPWLPSGPSHTSPILPQGLCTCRSLSPECSFSSSAPSNRTLLWWWKRSLFVQFNMVATSHLLAIDYLKCG